MWTGGVPLVNSRTSTWQFIAPGSRVLRNVKSRVVVGPVNQAIFEHWISSGDPLRNRHRMTDLAGRLRDGNVNGSQSMAIPGVEHKVLKNRRIVILLRDA